MMTQAFHQSLLRGWSPDGYGPNANPGKSTYRRTRWQQCCLCLFTPAHSGIRTCSSQHLVGSRSLLLFKGGSQQFWTHAAGGLTLFLCSLAARPPISSMCCTSSTSVLGSLPAVFFYCFCLYRVQWARCLSCIDAITTSTRLDLLHRVVLLNFYPERFPRGCTRTQEACRLLLRSRSWC